MSQCFTLLDAVEVPMRDGVTLVTDIWLPEGAGPWPVVLQRTPYRRDDPVGAQHIAALEFQSAMRRGYVVVVQDTRGRFASGGDFDPFTHEGHDGADTIAWLRAQSFCDGRVAMFGASYVGATQVLAAGQQPEGLVALAPHLTSLSHGDGWMYRGAATELGFLMLWIIEALAPPDLARRIDALDPATADHLRGFLSQATSDPAAAFARLPVLGADLVALAPYAQGWFDATRARSSGEDAIAATSNVDAAPPMLVSGGWNDIFVEGSIALFERARARYARAEDVPDRLILGPWSHGNPGDWQGDLWLGPTASTVDLAAQQIDFFDAVLAGRPADLPLVRYFRSGSNSWHCAADWPLPQTQEQVLHLEGSRLSRQKPAQDWHRSYLSDPLDPVPTTGGATFLPGLRQGRNSGPKDQSRVEAREDVLVFTSAPLEADLDITGLVRVRLKVQSDAPTCDWTARLCKVDDAGTSVGLVDGIYRWDNIKGAQVAQDVTVRLGHISHLVAAGHRLRLQVASSNFPRFDRNPQSTIPAPQATAGDCRTARQTVLGGPFAGSVLILPVIENAG
ncbi:Cocaine esterase [Aquimixticola soesokkakensis]|uniref:Cocaine esterase n=1 Tax=Aquimixticola soesokkakensis TaxID=1519096 RepID=A0A1Y5TJR3_9RHOB|nr:CocE/NonD family hydrolase [Aquimixticola soesokkakensis]SLN63585.1 Cocaine esterase [Aquimixticola soesokkakensis]